MKTEAGYNLEHDARVRAEERVVSLEKQLIAQAEAHREEVKQLLEHLAPIAQSTPGGQPESGMTLEEELMLARMNPAAGRTQIDDKRANIRRIEQLILKRPTSASDNGSSLSAEEQARLNERLQ